MTNIGTFSIGARVDFSQFDRDLAGISQRIRSATQSQGAFRPNIDTRAAEQSLERLAQAARRAQQAAQATMAPRVDTRQSEQALARLDATARRLRDAGGRIPVQVDTRQAEQQLSQFQQRLQSVQGAVTSGVARGLGQGLGIGVGAFAVAEATRGISEFVSAGVRMNAQLETSSAQFEVFTGSAEQAAAAVGALRQRAAVSPFGDQETIDAGAAFIRVAHGVREEMLHLVSDAEQLAATNPLEGLRGATFAIQEGLSGDFTSLVERFRVSREAIQQWKDQGLSNLQIVEKAIRSVGGSAELVDRLGKTFQGRASTFFAGVGEIVRSGAEGGFDVLGKALEESNAALAANGQSWQQWAREVGTQAAEAAVGVVKEVAEIIRQLNELNKIRVPTPGQILHGNFSGAPESAPQSQPTAPPAPAPQVISPQASAASANVAAIQSAIDAQGQGLTQTKRLIDENSLALARAKLTSDLLNASYEDALAPLQRQLETINAARNFNLERAIASNQAALAGNTIAREGALGDINVRADVAGRTVEINAQQELLTITHRRAEIQEALVDMQNRGKSAAEQEAEALTKSVQAMQENARAANDERSVALESIREQISLRQEQAAAAREAAQEQLAAFQEAYRGETEAAQRAHEDFQSGLRDRIQQLQDADREASARRGPSAAERQLSQLDASERQRQQAQSLESARRAIATATTGAARRDAIERFNEIKREQDIAKQREQLQQRIEKEREQREKQSAARQEQIRELERKAQQEERQYQRDRQAAQDAFQQQERQAQAELRTQEKAERAQQKQEQTDLRAQEKADRDADRAAQTQIREAQAAAEAARETAAQQREARETERQAAQDQRQRENFALEQQQLDQRERLLSVQDTGALAAVEAERVRLEQTGAILGAQQQIEEASKRIAALGVEQSIAAIEQAKRDDQRLLNAQNTAKELERQQAALTIQRQEAELALETEKKRLAQAKELADTLSRPAAGINAQGGVGSTPFGPAIPEGLFTPESSTDGSDATITRPRIMTAGGAVQGLGNVIGRINAELVSAANTIGEALLGGLIGTLSSDQGFIGAANKLMSDGLQAMRDAAGIRSPSEATAEIGANLAEGLVGGIASGQQGVNDALVAFFQGAWAAAAPQVDATITEVVSRFGGSDSTSLPVRLPAESSGPINDAIVKAFDDAWTQGAYRGPDNLLDEIEQRFEKIGDFIDSPQARSSIQQGIEDLFSPSVLGPAFDYANQNLRIYGNNAAVSFIDGYNAQMANFRPASSVGGGISTGDSMVINSSGGVGTSSYGPTLSGSTSTSSQQNPYHVSPGDIENYLVDQLGYRVGTPEYDEIYREKYDYYINQGVRPPPGFTVTGRAGGGPVWPGRMYQINEGLTGMGELFRRQSGETYLMPTTAGNILPPSSAGQGAMAGAGVGGGWGAPQVHLTIADGAFRMTSSGNWGGIDRDMLEQRLQRHGNEVMDDLVDILHASQKHAPKRSSRDLPGAR